MANGDIKITILGSGNGGENGGDGRKKKEKTPEQIARNKLQKALHPIQTAKSNLEDAVEARFGEKAGGIIGSIGMASKLLGDVASTTYKITMMEANRYFSLREDYISQNKINMIQSQISSAKSLTMSVLGSAASYGFLGAQGGPVGAAVGAVVGAAVGAVKGTINIETQNLQAREQYNMQLNAISAQTNFAASRANLINNGKGTEY